MAYTPQFYPGSTSVGINRRKHMSGNLEKLRDIPEADVVAIMGHRAPGADYSSTHPPLKEIGEPDCPVRDGYSDSRRRCRRPCQIFPVGRFILLRTLDPILEIILGSHQL